MWFDNFFTVKRSRLTDNILSVHTYANPIKPPSFCKAVL